MENFAPDVRRDNMVKLTNAINATDFDFNTLIFTFADLIQANFIQTLYARAKDEEERKAIEAEIVRLNDAMVEVLNEDKNSLMYHMVVLTNLMMDAVNNAYNLAKERQAE